MSGKFSVVILHRLQCRRQLDGKRKPLSKRRTIMAKSRKILATIEAIGEKKYSVYGNPSYGVWYRDVEGTYHYARTASNAQCGYVIDCMEKTAVILTCHETKSGRTIIDNAECVKTPFVVAGHGECHQVNGESEAKILGILRGCNVYETAAL